MQVSDAAIICSPAPSHLLHCFAVTDRGASWADSISPVCDQQDSMLATAEALDPSNDAKKTAPSTQCPLPSGLGTLTVATCETSMLQPWSSRELNGNSNKLNRGKRMESEPKLQKDLQVRDADAAAKSGSDKCLMSGRCRMQHKPTLKPGMTVTKTKNPARCPHSSFFQIPLYMVYIMTSATTCTPDHE